MAGSVAYSMNRINISDFWVEEHIWDWTADAADGSVPAMASDAKISGFVHLAVTNPGATAPTDLYDITLTDAEDVADVFGGELLNRATAATEQVIPAVGGGYSDRFVRSVLTMTLTGNAVLSATGVLKVYVKKF